MKKIFVLLLMTVFVLSACSASKAFGIKSIYDDGVDLRSCSEIFLKEIGMNDDEISSLREGLILSY